LPNDKSFWDKSDIETIKDLIDASDKEFMNALLNDGLMSNDIILEEQDAFADGFEPTNAPGSRWKLKPNKINAVRRLGGISNNTNALNMIEFIHGKIEETNGNFATKGADPPARVNTASGLAMIREDRDSRSQPKKIDRAGGFRRLYELIDWSVLEFYNQDRIVLIRGKTEDEPTQPVTFNSDNLKMPVPQTQSGGLDDFRIDQTGLEPEQTQEPNTYYPRIDCEINVGQGIAKSPALTLQATQELAAIPVTPTNIELVCSMVDQMALPAGTKIKDSLREAVKMLQPPSQPGADPNAVIDQPQALDQGASQEQISEFLNSMPPEMVQYILDTVPEEDQPQVIDEMMQMQPEELAQTIGDIMDAVEEQKAGE